MDKGKKNRLKIFFILFFFIVVSVFSQHKTAYEDQKLREEILAIYKAEGEQGLIDFVKKNQDKISPKFILDFAELGFEQREEEWLKISEIMAKEKKDKKTLVNVLYQTGECFRLISEYEKATEYFNKALPICLELNHLVGQGYIYMRIGNIYYSTGDNSKALKMYDKALLLLEKTGHTIGQGEIYMNKGDLYFYDGDYPKALKMCQKALTLFEKANDPQGLGNVYHSTGNIYFFMEKNSKALELYDKALFFFEKAEDQIGQAHAYQSKGEIYSHIGKLTKAFEMNKKALELYEKIKNPQGKGSVYQFMGEFYFYKGDISKAFEMLDKALFFFEKANSSIGQGNTYTSMGDVYFYTGNNPKALEMYDQALVFYEKVEESIGLGNVFFNKGYIFLKTGEYSKAFDMYTKAISFYKKTEELTGMGNVYLAEGIICFYKGDNSKAIEMCDQALAFFEKSGNIVGQGNAYKVKGDIYLYTGDNSNAFAMYEKSLHLFEKFGLPLNQGEIYMRKGTFYSRIGDISKSVEMYNKALTYFEKVGSPDGQGMVYQYLGEIHFYTGNYPRALEMCDKALPFFEKVGSPIGQGNVYVSIGDVYLKNGQNSKAVEMYNKALVFFEKTEFAIGLGSIYQRKGEINIKINLNPQAIEMHDKALTFFEKARNPIGLGNVYQRKGYIYLRIGKNLKALEMYNKALTFYKKTGEIESESFALHGKAAVLVKLGRKLEALEFFEKGIANLEKMRSRTFFSEMKRNFWEKVYDQYEDTVLFMLENKHYEKGFKYTESMRGRVFLDQMAEGLAKLGKRLKPDLREEKDRVIAKLSSLTRQMQETSTNEEKKWLKLIEEYHQMENKFEDLLVKIRLENPLYAEFNYPQPVSVKDLQKKVLKEGEILLSYFSYQDKVYAFLISKENFKVKPLKVKGKEIKGLGDIYLTALRGSDSRRLSRYGKILYEKLIQPLEKIIKENQTIIIAPDGKLATIPFESFIVDKKESGQPVYLVEKYRVKYIQSASVLSVLREHYHRDRTTNNFIGFGDPVYDYENFKQGEPDNGEPNPIKGDEIKEIHSVKYDREGGKHTRLEGSGEEVKAIAELFKKNSQKAALYLRADATEENAKTTDMKVFDYIHFGCHGILGETFQCLVLSRDIPDAKDDGYFTLNEIMNCEYNAKLVVLSACQTGSGKMYKGEGVTGLTRAVMYAGTPAVVASLWKVDDIATKELMINFYRNMLEKNLDKTEALRQAKLELIKNKNYRSPLFWSAFVMYGE